MRYDLSLLGMYVGSQPAVSRWSRDLWRFDSTEHALIVGLPGGRLRPGSARVFGRSGGSWSRSSALVPFDSQAGDGFGFQVAMENDAVAVTAPFAGGGAGAAYVYRWNGRAWYEEQKLVAPDSSRGMLFGGSVDIAADVVTVGAGHRGTRGVVYVFRRDGSSWAVEQRLCPEDGRRGDEFGYSVTMEREEIVVGAPSAHGRGVADVFVRQRGSWRQIQRLTEAEAGGGTDFGRHVAHALGWPTLVVGGSRLEQGGEKHSVAHLFERRGGQWRPFGILGPGPLTSRGFRAGG